MALQEIFKEGKRIYRESVRKYIEDKFNKSMRFRFHRGGLDESLSTTVFVHSIEELKSKLDPLTEEIKFKYVGFDSRCGWDTWYVSARNFGELDFSIVGMSDKEMNENN